MGDVDVGEVLPATEAERRGVADLLAALEPSEWAAPSLCAGWTVRDVAAHLASITRLTLIGAVVGVIRARGDLDRLIDDAARRRAREFSPSELVEQLRAHAASPRRPPGTTVWEPFVEALVHGQDIARPLGREHAMPLERVAPALTHLWSSPSGKAAKRFAGLRFVATDVAWAAGDGPDEVAAPAGELLLLSTGRPAGLASATGPGVAEARRRLGG